MKSNNPQSIVNKAVDGVIWRLLQNFSTTLVSFILQTWLARLLMPEHYGVIALTSVFITISLVFVQTGFTASLIQKPTLSELEINSVFYVSIFFAIVLYSLIFVFSPIIASFYSEPILSIVLKVQSLNIVIAALYSVPSSLIQRNFDFKKTFLAGLLSSILQGVFGIVLAMKGYGVWALVASSLMHSIVYCSILLKTVNWKPKLQFSLHAVKSLFPFSSRILLINLINTFFNNLKALIIGRIYNSELLGYYNKGFQLPTLIMNNVDGAINAVTFPLLSKYQHSLSDLSIKLRRTLQVSIFFVWPAMIGLIAVAKPLILLLLTEKWLLSVPFVQLTALICVVWPFSVFSHAINAIGRSDIALKLNIFSKLLALVFMAVSFQFGVYVFVFSSFISSLFSTSITILIASRLIKFSIIDIVKDCLPTLIVSILMGIAVYFISFVSLPLFLQLFLQIVFGGFLYLLITWIFKFKSLTFVIYYGKEKIKGRKR